MAGMFEFADIPAWENPARNILETGRETTAQVSHNFSSAYNQAQGVKDQETLMDYKRQMVQKQQQALATKLEPIAKTLSGADSPSAAWELVSKNPQWMADPQTAPFVQNYLGTQTKIAAAEVGSIAGKVKIADATDFAKRISTIQPEDRASIKGMTPEKDGTPSAMQWQALGLAEESNALHKENAQTMAEMQGAADAKNGVTTTVTDKAAGVTKKFAPEGAGSKPIIPTETMLSDGSKIVVNPKTGSFKFMAKDGRNKDFTKPQLESLAKSLQTSDPDDPNARSIMSFLSKQAVEQITPKTSAVTNTASGAGTTKSGLKYSIVPAQ